MTEEQLKARIKELREQIFASNDNDRILELSEQVIFLGKLKIALYGE